MGVFMCLKWVKLRSDVQGNKVSEIGPLIVQFLTFWHLLLDAIPPSRDRKVIPIHHVVCHTRLIYQTGFRMVISIQVHEGNCNVPTCQFHTISVTISVNCMSLIRLHEIVPNI
jgi:hypothetical protein